MSVSRAAIHPAQPVRRLSSLSGQARIKGLEQSLIRLAVQYQLKPNKPALDKLTLESQLARLEKGESLDFFVVLPWLVDTVKKHASMYSAGEKPIVLDIGGGTSSSHLRFAEAGMLSVCVDPAAEVLAKIAQRQGMIKVTEGVWKDRRLDHYLVVGDARTAAEIFGIDNEHPLLKSQAAKKQALLKELTDIARNFDPAKIDDALFPEDLQDIADCEERLRLFDAAENKEAIIKQLEEEENKYNGPRDTYKVLSEEKAREKLVRRLDWAREGLIYSKREHYCEAHMERIESLIDQLRAQDRLLEKTRIEVLRSIDEPPLIDLVFNGYMPCGIDLTPEIKSIFAKSMVYIAESGGGTGVEESAHPSEYQYFSRGFYNHSYEPGRSYQEEARESYDEPDPKRESWERPRNNTLIAQVRKDLAPPRTHRSPLEQLFSTDG
jgi:hypothetical protein